MWCIRTFISDNFEGDTRKPRNRAACCWPNVLMILCLMWPWPSDLQEGEQLNSMFGASMMFVEKYVALARATSFLYHVQFGDKSCQTIHHPCAHTAWRHRDVSVVRAAVWEKLTRLCCWPSTTCTQFWPVIFCTSPHCADIARVTSCPCWFVSTH